MKEKGFTLVELLAVIIILSMLALITGPIVIQKIEGARKETFKNSVEGVIRSIRSTENEFDYASETYTITNGVIFSSSGKKLSTKGGDKENGTVVVDDDGLIRAAIHNEKYCAIKLKNKNTITISNYSAATCTIPS